MQCTRLPATEEEDQKEEIITTQTATVIPRSPAVARDPLLQPTAVVEIEHHGRQQQLLRLTEVDLESGHCETVRLIPDCLEHIFKYLSTCDKGRVAQVRLIDGCSYLSTVCAVSYLQSRMVDF